MDVEVILTKLQQLGWIRLHKITGNYYTLHCPFHNDGNERKPSCGVLLTDQYRNGHKQSAGFWHCFSCSYAKPMEAAIKDLMSLHDVSGDAIKWLKENIPGFEYSEDDSDTLLSDSLAAQVNSKFAVDYINSMTNQNQSYISEDELAKYRYTIPYMYERHLTDDIIAMYDVGYDANWIPPGRHKPVPCITIPVRDRDGNTLFFCRRSVQGKMYNYPQDVTKPLFGIDVLPKCLTTLCICESAINCMTLATWGIPAVALLGTGNPHQVQQIKELGVANLILCMDGDEAGRKATKRLKRQLSKNALVWQIDMPDGKDINDIDEMTFRQLYDNRY